MNPIFKVQEHDWEFGMFRVEGKVKVVYDTNSFGTLLPVGFTQTGNTITLDHSYHGQVYYRYKKN